MTALILDEAGPITPESWAWFEKALAEGRVKQTIFSPTKTDREKAILAAADLVARQILLTSKGTPYLLDSKQARRAMRALLKAREMPKP